MTDDFAHITSTWKAADDKHRQWAAALRSAAGILEAGPKVGLDGPETPESATRLESALWRIVDVAGEIATDPAVDPELASRFTGRGFRVEPQGGWDATKAKGAGAREP